MPVVQNVARRADASAAGQTHVLIRVIGSAGVPVVAYQSDGTLVAPWRTRAGADGSWSATLPANSTLTPSGTAYEVIETPPGESARSSIITMPATGGPYQLLGVLSAVPGALLPAISASGVTVTPSGLILSTNVQAALEEVAARQASGPAGGALTGTYPNPGLAAGGVTDVAVAASAAIAEGKLALASDAAAGTPSRRTLGTGAAQAAAGNDSRLSDARPPTSHASSHASAGGDAVTLAESQVTNLTTDLAAKLVKASNLSDLTNAGTARTNLGLGALATLATVGSAQIDDGSVANADLANMAQSTIKGRAAAAGTGVPTDLTTAQALTVLGLNPTLGAFKVPVFGPCTANSGTQFVIGAVAGALYGAYAAGAGTDLNWGEWEILLPGGTYSLRVHYTKWSIAGKLQMSIDGTNVGALTDAYNATVALGVIDVTSVAIGTAGVWSSVKVRASANGKNASSTNYYVLLNDILLTKTA